LATLTVLSRNTVEMIPRWLLLLPMANRSRSAMNEPIGRCKMGRLPLHDELVSGKREFNSRFSSATRRSFKSGELLAAADRTKDLVYRVRSGWACQVRDLTDGRRAILDVYLPGDVIGLDTVLRTRPAGDVMALSSLTVESLGAEDGLSTLMAHRHMALYIAWLLSLRQRRSDRLLTAMTSLDARGRIAVMLLDFYKRLTAQKLITSTIYNLPLTQNQIGSYLGLTVVHVNRTLRALRQELVVNLEKHCVTILNLNQLTMLAQCRQVPTSPQNVELVLEAAQLS
jgi:CRP/FNR family transcriptional regulator, anaerobic regulatory protein